MSGYLWVTSEAERAERQRELVAVQRGWGLTDVELLAGDEARERFPYLSSTVIQARFRQRDGFVDTRQLTAALLDQARAKLVLATDVTGIRAPNRRLTAVRTSRGDIVTSRAVIAAGPLSGELATACGVRLPITTIRRQKVVMPDVPEVPADAPMTIDEDTGAHWRPAFRGAWLLYPDPKEPARRPERAVRGDPSFAFQLLDPASDVSVAHVTPFWADIWDRNTCHWIVQAGLYTMTPDHRPLIDETKVEGLFVNTGYSGHGIMSSPAGARVVVELLTDRLGRDENAFRIDRTFAAPPSGIF